MGRRKYLLGWLVLVISLMNVVPVQAQTQTPPPFGLPFNTPPGPTTWLLGQAYGNTTSAFAMRRIWYASGQGIHFGIDFSARCGTPVVAIGDGTVQIVDNLAYGSGPHNLVIMHPNGYASLYGHLIERPNLQVGQTVTRGEVIAHTGDPDLTCTSRPHLHLEIRPRSLNGTVDAVNFIDANWDALALVGAFGRGFQRNLDHPRQWQTLQDQPDIYWGGPLINDYKNTWPYDWR